MQAGQGDGGTDFEVAVRATEADDEEDERRRVSLRRSSRILSVVGSSDEFEMARLVWKALRVGGWALRRCESTGSGVGLSGARRERAQRAPAASSALMA